MKVSNVTDDPQLELGQLGIHKFQPDLRARNGMCMLLRCLHGLYCDPSSRAQLFELMERFIDPSVSRASGRPTKHMWQILVLGTSMYYLKCGVDDLVNYCNSHIDVRQMLGGMDVEHGNHGLFEFDRQLVMDIMSQASPALYGEVAMMAVWHRRALPKRLPASMRGRKSARPKKIPKAKPVVR